MKPKIVAKRGEELYLVKVSKDESRILDLNRLTYFPPFFTQSIIARGYWEVYKGKKGELEGLLKSVREVKPIE